MAEIAIMHSFFTDQSAKNIWQLNLYVFRSFSKYWTVLCITYFNKQELKDTYVLETIVSNLYCTIFRSLNMGVLCTIIW